MWRYILKRLLWIVIILICVAVLIFSIMYFVPGDPAELILGTTATEAELEACREELGLNEPYLVQLRSFLSSAFLHFDLGKSYIYRVPIADELARRIPKSLTLGWTCILLSSIIGIPLGISCALHQNGVLDHVLRVIMMVGISIPSFWLALLLVILFSVNLGWLPPYGVGGVEHWIMPVIAGSLGSIAMNARQTRSAVLETVRSDFVVTARAKGQREDKVIYKHMLPNALLPVVGSLGAAFASSIGGTVVIETIFSFPGVGTYLTNAITARDYPIVRGCVLVLAIFSATAMLLVDLVYAYMDPRIKAQYVSLGRGKK